MPPQGRRLPTPRGPLKWLLRSPINLYRLHLGWLLGERFMLLEHLGRKTGQWHTVVIEVVGHDHATDTYFAASGWRHRSDWYRNIQAHPLVRLSTGRRRRLTAVAHTLDRQSAGDRLIAYTRAHPFAARELGEIMGLPMTGDETEMRAAAESLPVVAFKVGRWPSSPPDPRAG
jgi:deazaflavin-dependent oxidoreductase (nitroreductase family)